MFYIIHMHHNRNNIISNKLVAIYVIYINNDLLFLLYVNIHGSTQLVVSMSYI